MAEPPSSSDPQQQAFNHYVADYNVELQWPPEITSGNGNGSNKTRTSHDLIHHRLLEASVLPEVP
eukprot:CAMPEP_0172446574 /NCGR_PEP_ID=MMETSP1065-20121228/6144_1 /TAXON_ID=265537 /ORGANISM="Amphiprora paludosa, Strain CCMP125" /LENGTH=64 /DNA_ID=CAMNT_0013197721 /DNA_START=21 /DNA_END=212 /DNA_ORIENTATION=+